VPAARGISGIGFGGDSRFAVQTERFVFGSAKNIERGDYQQRDEDYSWYNTAPNESVDHVFSFQV
jgi:hypothetical protein